VQDGPRTIVQISAALGEPVFSVREAAAAALRSGLLARQHGIGQNGGPNAWWYRPRLES
jgi:hypothetical protein